MIALRPEDIRPSTAIGPWFERALLRHHEAARPTAPRRPAVEINDHAGRRDARAEGVR